MTTIRLEYAVPEGDCFFCNLSIGESGIFKCLLFDTPLKQQEDQKVKRCQSCLDAEVKEGE